MCPKIVIPLKLPNASAHIETKTSAIPVLSHVAFLRLIFFSSVKNAIETSLIEMVEDSDAINNRKKKSDDQIMLPGSWLKMLGSISNTNVGPCSGDTPKVNTAGNIMTPARMATEVSSNAVVVALRTIRVLLLKYEP